MAHNVAMTNDPIIRLRHELATIWPDLQPTPLIDLPAIAAKIGIGHVFAKIEGERPLGNFKSLGGTLAGLRALARESGVATIADLLAFPWLTGSLPRLLCASDGNHGLSVAAAAQRARTQAIIFLPSSVDAIRTARIEAVGGVVRHVVGTYDEAVLEAKAAAARGEGILIPDTTQIIADPAVLDVMTGYSIITSELIDQFRTFRQWPSHAFIQAGVGGLAAAVADGLNTLPMHLAVVEPTNASCVATALSLGKPVQIEGNLETSADMLSCGLASAPALKILLGHGATSVLVEEKLLQIAKEKLCEYGVRTTESGAAGLAGLMRVSADKSLRRYHKLDASSIVLLIISEAAPSPCGKHYASGDTEDVQA